MKKRVILFMILLSFLKCFANEDDITNAQAMIKMFAPLVKLAGDEYYFPSSMPWYLKRVELKDHNLNVVKERGQVTPQDLEQYCDRGYYLDPDGDEQTYRGQPLENGTVVAPMYMNYVTIDDDRAVLQTIFFYPFNGATPLLQLVEAAQKCTGISGGNHEGDLEHIDIYLTKNDDNVEISKAFFARHGEDGIYIPGDKLKKHDSHPVVYSAQYGHASYNNSFWFPNRVLDQADGRGAQWKGWEHYELLNWQNPSEGQKWSKYLGSLGVLATLNRKSQGTKGAPHGMLDARWFRTKPHMQQLLKTIDIKVNSADSITSNEFKLSPPPEATKLIWKVTGPNSDLIRYSIKQDCLFGDYTVLGSISNKDNETSVIKGKDFYVSGLTGAKPGDQFQIKVESYY